MIPTHTKLQYAGGMGLLSWGIGWDYGKRGQWETDLLLVGLMRRYVATSPFSHIAVVDEHGKGYFAGGEPLNVNNDCLLYTSLAGTPAALAAFSAGPGPHGRNVRRAHHSPATVSYTHLDVYKRQGFQRLIISKRYIFPQKLEQLWALLNEKKAQYHIPQLLPDEVMNKLVLPTKERG